MLLIKHVAGLCSVIRIIYLVMSHQCPMGISDNHKVLLFMDMPLENIW